MRNILDEYEPVILGFFWGYGAETALSTSPILGWLALITATFWTAWYFYKKKKYGKYRFWALLLLGIFVWGALSIWRGERVIFPCITTTEAHEILRATEGKRGPMGRDEAIRCLIRADESLRYVDIRFAELNEFDFSDGKLEHMRFMDGMYNRANFRGAVLAGAQFSDAELNGAQFQGAYLGSANFGPGCIDGRNYPKPAEMRGVEFDEETDLYEAILYGVSDLTCDQLTQAKNWQTACRDEHLACGADIPACDFLITIAESIPPHLQCETDGTR